MSLSLLQHIHTSFEQELIQASQKQKTSLAFILNTIPSIPLVQNGDVFQALSIGGSMYRNSMLKKENTVSRILYDITNKLPVFRLEEDFLSFIDTHLHKETNVLALNFAYPLEPVFEKGRLDGKLTQGKKEHTFLGLVGKSVGGEIEKYIKNKYRREIVVSVANDTVCLILSGLTKTTWEHLAAGIVGTGLNFAMFLDKHTIVNLEAGSFANFPQTDTGKLVDKYSNMNGVGLFEKEVSGAYLYQHFNHLVEAKKLEYKALTDTTQLSLLAGKDIHVVSELAREQLERSAAFAATQIAGIASFKKQPLTFIMQGSLFWKGYQYKQTIQHYVHTLLPDYTINFIEVDNSDILGAAKLVA